MNDEESDETPKKSFAQRMRERRGETTHVDDEAVGRLAVEYIPMSTEAEQTVKLTLEEVLRALAAKTPAF